MRMQMRNGGAENMNDKEDIDEDLEDERAMNDEEILD